MRQRDRQFEDFVQRHGIGDGGIGIDGDGQIHFGAHIGRHRALIFDFQLQHGFFAQYRKSGGVGDDQAAVPIGGASCQQHVQRRRQRGGQTQIMHLAVSHQNRCCDSRAGLFGHCLRKGSHRQRARIFRAVAKAHHTQFGIL